jgi:hypothetical protein
VSWSDIKFIAEDVSDQVEDALTQARKLRQAEDPDEENQWMGDIISSLSIVSEEARSAYAKVALI